MLYLGKGVLAQLEQGSPDIVPGERGEHSEHGRTVSKVQQQHLEDRAFAMVRGQVSVMRTGAATREAFESTLLFLGSAVADTLIQGGKLLTTKEGGSNSDTKVSL